MQRKIMVDDRDNFGTLHDKLSNLGASVVSDTIDMIETGEFTLKEQNNTFASPAPKITKEISEIDWSKPAEEVHNLIRGLSPYPGAYFSLNNKIIKIYDSRVIEKEDIKSGEFRQSKANLTIGCGSKALEVLELQQEGKKRLKIEEFLRGFSFN